MPIQNETMDIWRYSYLFVLIVVNISNFRMHSVAAVPPPSIHRLNQFYILRFCLNIEENKNVEVIIL